MKAASIGDQILVRHLGGVKCNTIFPALDLYTHILYTHIAAMVFTTGHPWFKHVESVSAFGRFQVGTLPLLSHHLHTTKAILHPQLTEQGVRNHGLPDHAIALL